MIRESDSFNLKEDDSVVLDYFNSLDKDQDGFISFKDFLSPILSELTPQSLTSLLNVCAAANLLLSLNDVIFFRARR